MAKITINVPKPSHSLRETLQLPATGGGAGSVGAKGCLDVVSHAIAFSHYAASGESR